MSLSEEKSEGFRYHYKNPSYSYTDTLTLYGMIREFKPERTIKIGSGFSSCAMLDTSDRFLEGKVGFTFIEPYPALLQSLLKEEDSKQQVIPVDLQNVDKSLLGTLQENDILFVDSTHVSKLGSDVNVIVHEILPTLSKGVIVHFHDIFWPFESPKSWIREERAWNETYLLRAVLQFNEHFEILFFADYLHKFHPQWFREHLPLFLKNTGGNLWVRKTA